MKHSVCNVRALNVVLLSFRITEAEFFRTLESTPSKDINQYFNNMFHILNKQL